MKISAKTKNLVKHYIYALVVTAVGIYQTGNHSIKKVAWAALVAVGQPVVEAIYQKLKAKAA